MRPSPDFDVPYRGAAGRGLDFEVLTVRELRRKRLDHDFKRLHRVLFHALFVVKAGAGHHRVDFERIQLRPGSMLCLRSGQVHALVSKDTMTQRDTRTALLKAGLELFLEGGYDFAGTNAILARARAPRGSFYHHFADKQAFALAVAEYYYEQHLVMLDRVLSDETRTPRARLRHYFEALSHEYRKRLWSGGCLLGMLGQELADRDAGARDALTALFGRWRHRLASCLREARDTGELEAEVDCDELAGFLLDAWEGALMQMKLKKSGAPLDAFIRVTFDRLLASR